VALPPPRPTQPPNHQQPAHSLLLLLPLLLQKGCHHLPRDLEGEQQQQQHLYLCPYQR
jgi:transposase